MKKSLLKSAKENCVKFVQNIKNKVRKNITTRHLIIIIIIGLLIGIPAISGLVVGGHDLGFHANRFIGTMNALQHGQLFPQIDPDAIGGMGYAQNLFYGPLPAYIATFFRLITPSWSVAINAMVLLAIISSGVTMYFCARKVFKNNKIGLIASLVYMAAPYLTTDAFVRCAFGELFAFIFLPIAVLGLWKIIKNEKWGSTILGTGVAGLLASHNISAAIVMIFLALLCLLYIKDLLNWERIRKLIFGGVIALALSAFYILPLAEAKSATNYNVFQSGFMSSSDMASHSSLQLSELLLPQTNNKLGLNFAIGLVFSVALILLVILRKRILDRDKKSIAVFIVLSIISVILISPLFPWESLPEKFSIIQFPWRIELVLSFFLSLISGYSLYLAKDLFKNKNAYLATLSILLFLGVSLANMNMPRTRHLINYSYSSTYIMASVTDYLPTTVRNYATEDNGGHGETARYTLARKNELITLDGKATISKYNKDGLSANFSAKTEKGATIELPFIFYPGYRLSGKNDSINLTVSKNGFVQVTLPSNYNGEISVHHELSMWSKAGLTMTLLTTVVIIATVAYDRKLLKHKPRRG